eukprot:gene14479-11724_t
MVRKRHLLHARIDAAVLSAVPAGALPQARQALDVKSKRLQQQVDRLKRENQQLQEDATAALTAAAQAEQQREQA